MGGAGRYNTTARVCTSMSLTPSRASISTGSSRSAAANSDGTALFRRSARRGSGRVPLEVPAIARPGAKAGIIVGPTAPRRAERRAIAEDAQLSMAA